MILCAGEALIDMLPREATDGGNAFQPHAGGAVFNTAIALGRLGSSTGFFTGLSTDLFGEILTEGLAASNVDSSFAHRSDRPTTLAFVTLTDGHASYAFYDENTAGRMLTDADLPKLDESIKALFFGGISLVVEPCASAYEALAAREADKRIIMLDPNVRPSFIKDEAVYRARIQRMMGHADIVKVSDEDLKWLMDGKGLAEGAADVMALGPKVVFVTRGADGVTAYTKTFDVSVASERVAVVDTVGAGDTFNAGVLAALDDAGLLSDAGIEGITEEDLVAAMSLGARAAAVTVSRAGANPPRRDEL